MVTFLPGAPAALIESITGKVHDVEGIHDRPRAGEFFGGSARKAGESIHRDDLNALAPSGPVCKLLMGLLSGPLGVVHSVEDLPPRLVWIRRWLIGVFDPGGDPGVDLVAGCEGTSVVVLGCEGGPKGFGHGVIPAHCGLPHRHGSFHGAHVGGQLLGGELCSPISVEHDPTGKVPRVVAAMSSAVMTRSVLCRSPMAYPSTRRECASRTAHR